MKKLSFPTVKLGNFIREVKEKVKNSGISQDDFTVYGVTNTDGITVTNNKASDDLGNYTVLRENQFAYNPYRVNVGSIGLSLPGTFGAVSPAYVVFETNGQISNEFLLYYLKSSLGINLIKWYGDRGGVRSALRFSDLKKIDFPDITLEQQNKLLIKIKKLDKLFCELDKNLSADKIEILRQSILQQAVEGKLCEQDTNDESIQSLLEEIKEEKIQRCKSLKDKNYFLKEYEKVISSNSRLHIRAELICDHITKGTTPKTHDLTEAGDIPFLKVYNIVNNKINFHYRAQFISFEIHNASLSRSKVYPNDILINIVGPPLGKVAIVPKEYPEWNINQALAIFRCLPQIMPEYLYIILAEGSAINKIATVGTAGQDNISLKQCRDIEIPIPVLSEQKRIVNKVKHLLTLCDKLEQTVFQAKDYASKLMEAVLQEAFSVQETAKPAQVIEFHLDQTTPETELLAAARGKIREDTWEHLRKRALEIVGEES